MPRPVLHPALRRVWREPGTLQIGADPDRAVVIGGLDPPAVALVESLDGTRDRDGVLRRATELGLAPDRAERLLDLLDDAGVLVDAGADAGPLAALDLADRDRLAPDLAALGLLHPEGGPALLARRRRAAVAVRGLGRVGSLVCLVLAAAGVGRVVPRDAAPLTGADLTAATPARGDVGRRREDAVRDTLSVLAPATRTAPLKGRRAVDLVVVAAPASPVDPETAAELVRDDLPHLFVAVRETVGLVGPFVVPGRTACLRCQSLHRADRDPAWPTVSAQLTTTRARDAACDTVLATMVAAQAALHVLTWLDSARRVLPPSANGTLETSLPTGAVRRRTWVPHPACGCQWSRTG